MTRSETVSCICSTGVVAVIRMTDAQRLGKVVNAIAAGGVKCIEITMTVPGAVQLIGRLVREMPPDIVVGAGTVTDAETTKAVVNAGAKFVVGPILNLDVIRACKSADVACMPGCFSPTEILAGWNAGADIIKVFPATTLGPKFFKDIAGPFPHIKLMPTGGVSVENAGEWIRAGAVAVGIGTSLLDTTLIKSDDYEGLRKRAEQLVLNVQTARRV